MIRERNYCLDRLSLCSLCVSIPAAGAIGSVVGGGLQAGGSIAAANTEAGAANTASANQMAMYNKTRSDLSPFITGGGNVFSGLTGLAPGMTANLGGANNQLASLLGLGPGGMAGAMASLQSTPGYQFAQQQGQLGVDRSDAAKGLLLSGGQMKDTAAFNQNLASTTYNSAINNAMNFQNSMFSPLYNQAALGQNAAAGVGTAGMNAAEISGGNLMAGAGAVANGINNVASTFGNPLNNALQGYAMQGGAMTRIPGAISTGQAWSQANTHQHKESHQWKTLHTPTMKMPGGKARLTGSRPHMRRQKMSVEGHTAFGSPKGMAFPSTPGGGMAFPEAPGMVVSSDAGAAAPDDAGPAPAMPPAGPTG